MEQGSKDATLLEATELLSAMWHAPLIRGLFAPLSFAPKGFQLQTRSLISSWPRGDERDRLISWEYCAPCALDNWYARRLHRNQSELSHSQNAFPVPRPRRESGHFFLGHAVIALLERPRVSLTSATGNGPDLWAVE